MELLIQSDDRTRGDALKDACKRMLNLLDRTALDDTAWMEAFLKECRRLHNLTWTPKQ